MPKKYRVCVPDGWGNAAWEELAEFGFYVEEYTEDDE